ncbi:MAG TPA: hypothetical protein PKA76_19505 [Pirellulaceae bacterium]|nr:hypothetical protein [Pirellulaceae bacterium]
MPDPEEIQNAELDKADAITIIELSVNTIERRLGPAASDFKVGEAIQRIKSAVNRLRLFSEPVAEDENEKTRMAQFGQTMFDMVVSMCEAGQELDRPIVDEPLHTVTDAYIKCWQRLKRKNELLASELARFKTELFRRKIEQVALRGLAEDVATRLKRRIPFNMRTSVDQSDIAALDAWERWHNKHSPPVEGDAST